MTGTQDALGFASVGVAIMQIEKRKGNDMTKLFPTAGESVQRRGRIKPARVWEFQMLFRCTFDGGLPMASQDDGTYASQIALDEALTAIR